MSRHRGNDRQPRSGRWPGVIGGTFGYVLLKKLAADRHRLEVATAYRHRSKLESLLGPEIWTLVRDRTVIDFGCGDGTDAIELAKHGARRVIGLDLRERVLAVAREKSAREGMESRCVFTTATTETADVIVSMDGFEHYEDPAAVLDIMRTLVRDDGVVLATFGPPWFHPLGGHLFSVFPWAHLVFTESALIRWRSDFKFDGARRFSEVEGGLNQMTIRCFERLLDESSFTVEAFETVPIRRARPLHTPLTREFLTAVVRCRLRPRRRAVDVAA